ncbi:tyrosine-type recombinase/integrase [Thauera humireducens]|uniref:tyrosine-type recombinase/integrase n=1 Tax=Thauera humireducens TaxID=1134435 RepID=UPI003C74BB3E
MPAIDPGRDRVLTNDEWLRISEELVKYGNPYVAPLACLMLETTMRSGEQLVSLLWRHINWTQRVIELPDAKSGTRKVPLGPGALHVLRQMRAHVPSPPQPDDMVFPITYEAAKKAWAVARERRGSRTSICMTCGTRPQPAFRSSSRAMCQCSWSSLGTRPCRCSCAM